MLTIIFQNYHQTLMKCVKIIFIFNARFYYMEKYICKQEKLNTLNSEIARVKIQHAIHFS